MFLDNKVVQLNSQETTLHHIALNVALEDFESEKKHLEGLGLKVDATVHEWLHVWRHGATLLPRSRGEFAGVCLLRCKLGIGEMLAYTQRAPSQVLPVLPQAPVRWTSPPQSLTQSHPVSNFAWILILLILRFHPIADFA